MKTMLAMGTCLQHYGDHQIYRWLEHHAPHLKPWGVTKIGISNDGPTKIATDWITEAFRPESMASPAPVMMHKWHERLGIKDQWTYPGNWRNLSTIMRMAKLCEFERVIYTEWDFFIYSQRMVYRIAAMNEGIHTFWCPHYTFAEAAFMCIHKDHFSVVESVANHMMGVEKVTDIHQTMEHAIPWTRVHQDFVGDRYPDFDGELPPNVDFCAQLNFNKGIAKMLKKMMSSPNQAELDGLEKAIAFKPED